MNISGSPPNTRVMESTTIRLPEDVLERVDEHAEDRDVSRSEYLRTLVRRGFEYDEVVAERDRLENQLRTLIDQREEHQELVEYVDEEKTWREASLKTRIQWWIWGKE